jgi:hypothetical protein
MAIYPLVNGRSSSKYKGAIELIFLTNLSSGGEFEDFLAGILVFLGGLAPQTPHRGQGVAPGPPAQGS